MPGCISNCQVLNIMKKYLFLIVIISLVFLRCSEDSNPIVNGEDSSLLIEGKVSNYGGYFDKVYTSCYPDSDSSLTVESEIKADGSFNLSIPIPLENHLYSYTPFDHVSVINGDSSIFIDSIYIVDSRLKYTRYDLFAERAGSITYSLPINLARITNPGEFAKAGDYFISYYYFNSQTKIQGYYRWRVVATDSSREIKTEFNINTKIGWNKVITKYKSENANTAIYEVTDIDDGQGEWIIGANDSFPNAVRRF